MFKPFVATNFGEEQAQNLTPFVSLGDTERRNFEKTLTAYANAYAKGFIKESQLPPIHAELGFTPALPNEGTNQPPKEQAQGAVAG